MHAYLRYALDRQEEIIALISRLAQLESPTDSAMHVDQATELLAQETEDIATAEMIATNGFGRHLRLEFRLAGGSAGDQILALGHSDTVWPVGTLAHMPVHESSGRLWGPGVLDMKSGLAFFVYAMRALRDLQVPVARQVTMLVVSDEEVGSPTSRSLTESEAQKSRAVLVLEPGTGLAGKLKTARKGVGRYLVRIEGRAAHAGVDFGAGASAIVEAAHQVQRLTALNDPARGITVNPGVIRGGTRSNVVAAKAEIEVDVRVVTATDAGEVHRRLCNLRQVDSRCSINVEGGLNRPPMERSAGIARLFETAREVGRDIGKEVEESATGGGSDGNFTAAIGVPTLDGLGGVGEGAHAIHESILLDRVSDRIALLAGLVAKLGSEASQGADCA